MQTIENLPADLNYTAGVAWRDKENCTPITDVWTIQRNARERYGFKIERMEMRWGEIESFRSSHQVIRAATMDSVTKAEDLKPIPLADAIALIRRTLDVELLLSDEAEVEHIFFTSQGKMVAHLRT